MLSLTQIISVILCDKTEIVLWRKFKSLKVLSKFKQSSKPTKTIYFSLQTDHSTTYFIFTGENISTVPINFACFSDLFYEAFVWAWLFATDCLISIYFFWNATTANRVIWVARLPSLLFLLWSSGLTGGERSCNCRKRSLLHYSGFKDKGFLINYGGSIAKGRHWHLWKRLNVWTWRTGEHNC